MGHTKLDELRISPKFTARDWQNLDRANPHNWRTASEIVRDRLDGRYLRYAGNCLRSPHSGFVVLSIHSILMETLQQYREGEIDGRGRSGHLVREYLKGKRFQPDFDSDARDAYYNDIRCGLLHQAEARRKWLVRRDQGSMLLPLPHGDGYIIDVRQFHKCIRMSFNDYLAQIRHPKNNKLRDNLWVKMDHICNVEEQRGALEADEIGGDNSKE